MKVALEKPSVKLRAGEEAKMDRRTTIEQEFSLIEAKHVHVVEAIAVDDKASLKIASASLDFLRAHNSKRCG